MAENATYLSDRCKHLAEKLYVALISNSSRYDYMKQLKESGMSSDEVTMKNINKAFRLAEQFLDETQKR